MEQENIIENEIEETEQQEQPQVEEQQQPEQPEKKPELDDRERNLAALREARERAEKERDEAIEYIKQLQQRQLPPEEQDPDLDPDDLVEWKYVDKKIKKLESKISQYENQTAYQMTEARLKSQFNDFDNVVTKENIEALRLAHPEIAQALHSTPDLYNKAVSTYNIIKKFGIGHVSPQALHDKEAIARNMSKPRATNSVSPQQGDSPLSKANDFASGNLTEERKAQLYREMMQARNNY